MELGSHEISDRTAAAKSCRAFMQNDLLCSPCWLRLIQEAGRRACARGSHVLLQRGERTPEVSSYQVQLHHLCYSLQSLKGDYVGGYYMGE